MERFARNLYDLQDERVLFQDRLLGVHTTVLFGLLEPNASIVLHLLRPEYKANGWFRLTYPKAWKFGAAQILFDAQVRTLKDLIERDARDDCPSMTWLTGETENDILVYIDLSRVNVYAPWEEANGVGLLPSDSVNTQDKLLRQSAHHPIQATVQLKYLPTLADDVAPNSQKCGRRVQAFIAEVTQIHIVPV